MLANFERDTIIITSNIFVRFGARRFKVLLGFCPLWSHGTLRQPYHCHNAHKAIMYMLNLHESKWDRVHITCEESRNASPQAVNCVLSRPLCELIGLFSIPLCRYNSCYLCPRIFITTQSHGKKHHEDMLYITHLTESLSLHNASWVNQE